MRSSRFVLVVAALAAAACKGRTVDADHDGVEARFDCDDSNPAVHALVTGYLDADHDGFGAGAAVTLCTDGGLPAGYSAQGDDCAADDGLAWRRVADPPVDRDGDGFTAHEGGSLCVGATLPEPYRTADRGLDCDDADPARWRWVTLYRDRDGDGVGAGPRLAPWTCLGAALPAGFAVTGYDRDDADPAVTGDPGEDDLLAIVLD